MQIDIIGDLILNHPYKERRGRVSRRSTTFFYSVGLCELPDSLFWNSSSRFVYLFLMFIYKIVIVCVGAVPLFDFVNQAAVLCGEHAFCISLCKGIPHLHLPKAANSPVWKNCLRKLSGNSNFAIFLNIPRLILIDFTLFIDTVIRVDKTGVNRFC